MENDPSISAGVPTQKDQRVEWARVNGLAIFWSGGDGPRGAQTEITQAQFEQLSLGEQANWSMKTSSDPVVPGTRHPQPTYVRDYFELPNGQYVWDTVGKSNTPSWYVFENGQYWYDSTVNQLIMRTPTERVGYRYVKESDEGSPGDFFGGRRSLFDDDDEMDVDVDVTIPFEEMDVDEPDLKRPRTDLEDYLVDPPPLRRRRVDTQRSLREMSQPLLLDPPQAAAGLTLPVLGKRLHTGYVHAGPSLSGYISSLGSSNTQVLSAVDGIARRHDLDVEAALKDRNRSSRLRQLDTADNRFRKSLTKLYTDRLIPWYEYQLMYAASFGMPAYYGMLASDNLRKFRRLNEDE